MRIRSALPRIPARCGRKFSEPIHPTDTARTTFLPADDHPSGGRSFVQCERTAESRKTGDQPDAKSARAAASARLESKHGGHSRKKGAGLGAGGRCADRGNALRRPGARPEQRRGQVQVEPRGCLRQRGGVAGGQGQARRRDPDSRTLPRPAHIVRGNTGRCLDRLYALDKGLSRLYIYAGSLADQDTRDQAHQGMQQEMVQLAAAFGAAASYIEPEILQADKAKIESFLAASRASRSTPSICDDVLRRAAHTLSDVRGEAAGRRRSARHGGQRLQHSLERRFPVPVGHAERWQDGQARSGQLHGAPRPPRARRSREGDVGLLHRARHVQPHLRHDDERRSAEGAVLDQGPQVRFAARVRAQCREHPDGGLHPADRGREPKPARLSPLPQSAQADDGAEGAALLRPVRTAGRLGGLEVHA